MKRILLFVILSGLYLMGAAQMVDLCFPGTPTCIRSYNDSLFVSCSDGIYSYDLNKQQGWQEYAFIGTPVENFVMSNHHILITTHSAKMVMSDDFGLTQKDITPEEISPDDVGANIGPFSQSPWNLQHIFYAFNATMPDFSFRANTFLKISYDGGHTWNCVQLFEDERIRPFGQMKFVENCFDADHVVAYGVDLVRTNISPVIVETFDDFAHVDWNYIGGESVIDCFPEYVSDLLFCSKPDADLIAVSPYNGILLRHPETHIWRRLVQPEDCCFVCIVESDEKDHLFYALSVQVSEYITRLSILQSDDLGETWTELFIPQEVTEHGVGNIYGTKWKMLLVNDRSLVICGDDRVYCYDLPQSLGIEECIHNSKEKKQEFYNFYGRKNSSLIKGLNLVKNAEGLVKKIWYY